MAPFLNPGRATALIAAHPGHETLLHHWLERSRPSVFVLTDGSGGAAEARIEYSRRLVENAGARCGSVFGAASDQRWYRRLLAGDARPFDKVIDRIAEECLQLNVDALISDPVELFNPIHDLTNVIAQVVGQRLAARRGRAVDMLTYPIERPESFTARAGSALALNKAAAARKDEAIAAYRPLAGEYPRYRELVTRDHELLIVDRPAFSWPAELREEPYYERFGRQRLLEGRYSTLLTYADHVRPLALQLLGERVR